MISGEVQVILDQRKDMNQSSTMINEGGDDPEEYKKNDPVRLRIDELSKKMDQMTENILGRFDQNAEVVQAIEQRVSALSNRLDG